MLISKVGPNVDVERINLAGDFVGKTNECWCCGSHVYFESLDDVTLNESNGEATFYCEVCGQNNLLTRSPLAIREIKRKKQEAARFLTTDDPYLRVSTWVYKAMLYLWLCGPLPIFLLYVTLEAFGGLWGIAWSVLYLLLFGHLIEHEVSRKGRL